MTEESPDIVYTSSTQLHVERLALTAIGTPYIIELSRREAPLMLQRIRSSYSRIRKLARNKNTKLQAFKILAEVRDVIGEEDKVQLILMRVTSTTTRVSDSVRKTLKTLEL